MKLRKIVLLLLLSQFLVSMAGNCRAIALGSDTYLNIRFWEAEIGRCFSYQVTSNSCVSAATQMVLKYLDYSPLPNQTELATEMHTNIDQTTQWRYTYIPFLNRGFSEYFNQSLSNDFDTAISYLKGNISQNFPAIIDTWYDENAKSSGSVTHARVPTGYNLTGIFFHDPLSGPNEFMNYSELSSLWKTDNGFWAFIIRSEPRFNITVVAKDGFGRAVQGVQFALDNGINSSKVTGSDGIA